MRVLLIVILALVFSSCVRNKNGQAYSNQATQTNAKMFEVKEVVQASSYTYLKVIENSAERWVAVAKNEFKKGDILYYDEALEMNNFTSKDLDRTFDVIYFVNAVSKTPMEQQKMDMAAMHQGNSRAGNAEIEMNKSENELTLADLFKDKSKYTSAEFEIKGVVVKVNREIMGKNWIHIQDGTAYNGNFDLTITTQELPEVGEEVVFKGKLTLDKDFGSGYSYKVIMEDAELVKEKALSTQL